MVPLQNWRWTQRDFDQLVLLDSRCSFFWFLFGSILGSSFWWAVFVSPNPPLNSGNIVVTIQTRYGLTIRDSNLDYRGFKSLVEKLEGSCWQFLVWRISIIFQLFTICPVSLLVFLKSSVRVITVILFRGGVYIFMSKDEKKVKMIHNERHAYYLHVKSFTNGYRFMWVELKDRSRGITYPNIKARLSRASGVEIFSWRYWSLCWYGSWRKERLRTLPSWAVGREAGTDEPCVSWFLWA